MILIPDVHGRTFWKAAVKEAKENEPIVFLGDYLDPYPYQRDEASQNIITEESSLDNFKEILEVAKSDSRITLLIGNHDIEYFIPNAVKCRCYEDKFVEISKLFIDNLDMFKIILVLKSKNGLDITLSHSGLCKKYITFNKDIFGDNPTIAEIAEKLNGFKNDDNVKSSLSQVGEYRWGYHDVGSVLWADVHEVIEDGLTNVFQIFGHTQQTGGFPIYGEHLAMLDCHRAFRLDLEEETIECLFEKGKGFDIKAKKWRVDKLSSSDI